MSWDLRGEEPLTRETLPHPSVHVVIEEGGSRVIGVARGRFSRVLEGRGRVLGVKFLPGGFRPFSPWPVSALADSSRSLTDTFGRHGDRLEADVLRCGDDEQAAVGVAEMFFLARLPAQDAKAELTRHIVHTILEDRTLVRAEEVARTFGLTLRRLQRLFSEYVGASPKWVIQRYRLHDAIDRLDAGEPVDLAALASALGYFDQAHFIKAFRSLVGRTPAAYARDSGKW